MKILIEFIIEASISILWIQRIWHEMAKERMLRIKYSICYEPSDTSFTYYKLVKDAFEFDIDINEYPVEE